MKFFKRFSFTILFLSLIVNFYGCGGGSGGGDDTSTNQNTSTTVSGIASKGPLSGAKVEIFKIVDGKKGDSLGSTTTDANGNYELQLTNWTGPVIAIASGGTYTDEATKSSKTLSFELRAVISDASSKIKASVTPLTELAAREAEKSGFSKETIESSNKKIAQLIGCDSDITTIIPFDPTKSGESEGKTDDEKKYTLFLAAISELSNTNSNKPVKDILSNFEEDLKDGKLDATESEIGSAITSYSEKTGDWVEDSIKQSVTDQITELKDNGFEPTGDLAEAKKKLISFVTAVNNEKNPDYSDQKYKFEEFLSYMNSFVGDSSEAHLLKAVAIMADIYNNDSVVDIIKTQMGVDNIFDPEKRDKVDDSDVIKKLLSVSAGKQDFEGMLTALEAKLKSLKEELGEVENKNDLKFSFSLTGMDTLYFSQIDVKVMQAMAEAGLAAVNLLQAHKFDVSSWEVSYNGTTYDFSKILSGDVEVDDNVENELFKQFFENNTSFLAFADGSQTELDAAVDNILQCKELLKDLNTKLQALSDAERKNMAESVFNIDIYTINLLNIWVTEVFPEADNFLKQSGIDVLYIDDEDEVSGTDSLFIESGYFYWFNKQAVEKVTMSATDLAKTKKLTIGDFFLGATPLRNFILSGIKEEGKLYEDSHTEKLTEFDDIHYDEPMGPVIKVEKADIKIDGDSSDWANIKAIELPDDMGIELKIARGENNMFYFKMSASGNVNLNLSSQSVPYSNLKDSYINIDSSQVTGHNPYSYNLNNFGYKYLNDGNGVEFSLQSSAENSITAEDIYSYIGVSTTNGWINKEVKFIQ